MTLQETLKIMAILKAAYPAYYKGISREEAESAAKLWQSMFADDDPAIVTAAVTIMIATKEEGYPPTIGAVKAKMAQLVCPDNMTAQEAWAIASHAAQSFEWGRPDKMFNSLPPRVRKAIGTPSVLADWGKTDEKTFATVVYSNFIRTYAAVEAREKELAMLPTGIKEMLSEASNNYLKTISTDNQYLAAVPPSETADEIDSTT